MTNPAGQKYESLKAALPSKCVYSVREKIAPTPPTLPPPPHPTKKKKKKKATDTQNPTKTEYQKPHKNRISDLLKDGFCFPLSHNAEEKKKRKKKKKEAPYKLHYFQNVFYSVMEKKASTPTPHPPPPITKPPEYQICCVLAFCFRCPTIAVKGSGSL